jgi:hypothetical protein
MKVSCLAISRETRHEDQLSAALNFLDEFLWSIKPSPISEGSALRRGIWAPLLALLASAPLGSEEEARACRLGAWLMGHPSAGGFPIPQLAEGGSPDRKAGAPRSTILAAVRVLDSVLRAEIQRGRPLLFRSREIALSATSGEILNIAPGVEVISGASAEPRRSNLVLPGRPTPPPQPPPRIHVIEPLAVPEAPKSRIEANISLASFGPTPSLAQVVLFSHGGSAVESLAEVLMLVAETFHIPDAMSEPVAQSATVDNEPPKDEVKDSVQRHDVAEGPTTLTLAAAHCALRLFICIAGAGQSKRDAGQPHPIALIAATATRASTVLWKLLPLVQRLVSLLHRWQGQPPQPRKKPAVAALEDISLVHLSAK